MKKLDEPRQSGLFTIGDCGRPAPTVHMAKN
jgi:hypothetical protein